MYGLVGKPVKLRYTGLHFVARERSHDCRQLKNRLPGSRRLVRTGSLIREYPDTREARPSPSLPASECGADLDRRSARREAAEILVKPRTPIRRGGLWHATSAGADRAGAW